MRTSLAELGSRSDEPTRRSRDQAIQIGLNWIGSTGSVDQEQPQEDEGDEAAWEVHGRSSTALALCFSAIGLSAFPSTETLLLQTSLFVKCVDWPEYYGLASIALFVPGLIVQMLQNSYDQTVNLRFGLQPAMVARLFFGHAIQLAALLAFFVQLRNDDPDGDGVFVGSVEGKQLLLVVCFVTIGTGCAIVYGSCAQLVALFPRSHHAFFFIGTYSVSVVLSPVNYLIGDLYNVDAATMECNSVHWKRLAFYYGIGSCCNAAGIVAFVVLLWCTSVGRRKMYSIEQKRQKDVLEQLLAPPAAQLERTHSAPLAEVWRRCFKVGLTMILSLAQNMIVCNYYIRLPVVGSIPSLPTVMMYSFYVSQCLGSATVMNNTISRVLSTPVLFVLAVIRLPGIPMIMYYTSQTQSDVANGTAKYASDWGIFVFFSIYMWLGGMIFSQSFSLATSLFKRSDDRALGASVMNVLYYLGLAAVSGGILLDEGFFSSAAQVDPDGCVQRRMLSRGMMHAAGDCSGSS
jgi:hypothetical protein